jgi:arginyl-tRNA synthetase
LHPSHHCHRPSQQFCDQRRLTTRQRLELFVDVAEILDADLAPLTHERELELLRALAAYPDVVAEAAAVRAPHRVATWVRDFAKEFHGFYRDCRVISDDAALTQARLWLGESCRLGLASALAILGVQAPDEMHRLPADDDGEGDGVSENDEPEKSS